MTPLWTAFTLGCFWLHAWLALWGLGGGYSLGALHRRPVGWAEGVEPRAVCGD